MLDEVAATGGYKHNHIQLGTTIISKDRILETTRVCVCHHGSSVCIERENSLSAGDSSCSS